MKILIYSPLFYPSVGGLETIISTLAHEFTYQGHQVKIVSQTPATNSKIFPFEVIRKPSLQRVFNLINWCDVYFQGCVSLKGLYPLIFVPRPLIITHHAWYQRVNGNLGWQDYLKKFVTRFATNISVSHALAATIPAPSSVIPNSYQEDIFYEIPEIIRNRELVFLGRLVSDKGVNLLLDALSQLKSMGLSPQLTIIGSGPEEPILRQQAKDLKIIEHVSFVGVKVEHELTQLLNAHQIMVVPSIWNEPFGIVALEGIACGCVVVGSQGGGLKDAIGSCGVTFPNGDVQALTQILFNLLQNPEQLATYRNNSPSHLLRHQKSTVATAYLEVIEAAIR
ncbi:glycosyltransferase family 4 protein [Tolypothrix sp. FACHB-123]|uniref:glycosyltransferase family 4 protein n=1 Tax=Tolypothrix sp. FACHB-123 TaxID=2692868 RepID=UPI001687AAF8|nr:glycosyltransferase family 4 protein [Tolypothrix sp. FACHB-123]MBD2358434.1 glycosyltransferase family 4 protein [Tolypothrix sp. FACHB-123]